MFVGTRCLGRKRDRGVDRVAREGINPSPTIEKPNEVGLPYRASFQLGEDFDQLIYASC